MSFLGRLLGKSAKKQVKSVQKKLKAKPPAPARTAPTKIEWSSPKRAMTLG
jgi:hypothetical protein